MMTEEEKSLDDFFDSLQQEQANEPKPVKPRVHVGGSTCTSCEG